MQSLYPAGALVNFFLAYEDVIGSGHILLLVCPKNSKTIL